MISYVSESPKGNLFLRLLSGFCVYPGQAFLCRSNSLSNNVFPRITPADPSLPCVLGAGGISPQNSGTRTKAARRFQGRSAGGRGSVPAGRRAGRQGRAPGAGMRVSKLSVKPTEELTEVILPRRAAADDLAVNRSGSGEIGGKPGRVAARERGELLLRQVGEKRRVPEARCRWAASPACNGLWTSK